MNSGVNRAPVTGLVLADRTGAPLVALTVPGVVTRLATVAPIAVALAVLHRLASDPPWWPSLAVLGLATAAAAFPDSAVGLATLGGLVAWWLVAVEEPAVWWAVLVSGCALVFHVALGHAAAAPAGASPSRGVVGRLAARCGGLLLITVAVAAFAEGANGWGEPPVLAVGLTLALVGALPWLARRSG